MSVLLQIRKILVRTNPFFDMLQLPVVHEGNVGLWSTVGLADLNHRLVELRGLCCDRVQTIDYDGARQHGGSSDRGRVIRALADDVTF